MFNVTGKLINSFLSPATEKYPASYKVQILGDSPLIDGQVKMEMLTLNVPEPVFNSLQGQSGKDVTLPIGFYLKDNSIMTFFPKHGAQKLVSKA